MATGSKLQYRKLIKRIEMLLINNLKDFTDLISSHWTYSKFIDIIIW